MTMPAGTYYVGDLCYVMHERWDEFCDITIDERTCRDGEFVMKDGTRFATYGTKWGDGSYSDESGRKYSVDAGLIGCVRMEDIELDMDGNSTNGGQVIEFKEPFETRSENGVIYIGDVCIDTDSSYYDVWEEEDL
jgi:hypothetical protein